MQFLIVLSFSRCINLIIYILPHSVMSAVFHQRGRYEGLPKKILGLHCTQHRVVKIREIFDFYNLGYTKGTNKIDMLFLLVQFLEELPRREINALESWIRTLESTQDDLHTAVIEADGPTLRPQNGLTKVRRSVKKKARKTAAATQLPPTVITPTDWECIVCTETFTEDSLPRSHVTPSCEHDPSICFPCLTQSLDIQIRERSWTDIKCPSCPELLTYDCIRLLASSETFDR